MVERILRYLLIVLLVLLVGCKGKRGKQGKQRNMGVTGYIEPSSPKSNTKLLLHYVSPPGTKILWFVNNILVLEGSDTLSPSNFNSGDTVKVVLEASTGKRTTLGSVVILNTIPVIKSGRVLPENPVNGQELYVEAQPYDEDGDEVSLKVKWYINGKFVFEGDTLPGDKIKAGDLVTCEVIPYDGVSYGRPLKLNVPKIVQNTPPRIIAGKGYFVDKTFIMPIHVEDPDGDKFNVTIEKGPEGIEIKSDTLFWECSLDSSATLPVEVKAEDDKHGVTTLKFNIVVKKTKE